MDHHDHGLDGFHMSNVTLTTSMNTTFSEYCNGSDNILDLHHASEDAISRYLYSAPETRIILTLYPLSLLIGLTGNFAFLATIAFAPEMRTITNAYLGNLAVADILFLCTLNYDVLMGYILSPVVKSTPYVSSFGCAFRVCIQFTSHVTIVGLIFLVTIERYLAICKPLKHKMVAAKGRTLKLIIVVWTVGFLFASLIIPSVAVFKKTCVIWPDIPQYDRYPRVLKSCNSVLPIFGMFKDILLIPLLIILITTMTLYARIIRSLNKRVSKKSQINSAGLPDAVQIRNQVARLLIATGTFFFFFCCIPEFTLHFNKLILTLSEGEIGFRMTPKQQWYVVWLARGMTTCSAVVNPIIYGLTNQRYRDAFINLLRCGAKKSLPVVANTSTATDTTTFP